MKALYKRQGDKGFREIEVENELRALQQLVGGYIECVYLSPEACVICNEEGRIYGMAHNCVFEGIDYVGPILVVGVDGDEFTDCPISVAMANKGVGLK